MKGILAVLAVVAAFSLGAGYSAWSEPETLEECAFKKLKGVSSDVAAARIFATCKRLYPRGEVDFSGVGS